MDQATAAGLGSADIGRERSARAGTQRAEEPGALTCLSRSVSTMSMCQHSAVSDVGMKTEMIEKTPKLFSFSYFFI